MGKKRKPASKESNQPPTSNEKDVPRAFRRILAYQKHGERKLKEKEEANGTKDVKSKDMGLKIGAKESFQSFARRVEKASRSSITQTMKSVTKKSQKRKAYFTSKKQKQKSTDKEEEEEMNNRGKIMVNKTDDVRFGEVAMEPPKISVLPRGAKKLGKSSDNEMKRGLALEDKLQPKREERDEEEDPNSLIKKKRKLKDMGIGERRIVEVERERAIQHYRMLKAAKMLKQQEEEE